MAREDGLEERAEDELGTTASVLVTIQAPRMETGIPSLGKSKPEGEDQLECVVEWEPVNNRDQALNHTVIVRKVSQNLIKMIIGVFHVKNPNTTQYYAQVSYVCLDRLRS